MYLLQGGAAPLIAQHMAAWSSGMILASGARGPGFNSRSSPFLVGHARVSATLTKQTDRFNMSSIKTRILPESAIF